MSQNEYDLEPRWYVVHTYTGYENNVKKNLENTIKNRELQDFFFDIVVPMEQKIEIKNGKTKTSLKKVFPGYILIKMIVTEQTWYIVRNTRGVTGFVGSGTNPIPLKDSEIRQMGLETNISINVDVGDHVKIIRGAFSGKEGTVAEIDKERQKIKVFISSDDSVNEIKVEVDFTSVEKL